MAGSLLIEGRGQVVEHLMARRETTLGRAPDNDVTLDDPIVSRHHARIIAGPAGVKIVDLGSANGTRLQGQELAPREPRPLADGDVIEIGPFTMTYRADASVRVAPQGPPSDQEVPPDRRTVVVAPLLPPRLAVFTPEGRQDHPLLNATVTLGREADNDIVIESDVVSRHHARLEREGADYVIVDLGSTNGLIVDGTRVQRRALKNGDTLKIGRTVTLEYREAQEPVPARPAAAGRAGTEAAGRAAAAAGAAAAAAPAPQWVEVPAGGKVVLGRGESADVTFSHPRVSRYHAQVVQQGGNLVVQDLGSATGTYVNGQPVQERALAEGDRVRIGSHVLVVQEGRLRVVEEEGNLRLDALHLQKVVGKGKNILQDISLSVLPQEFVAVVGASGSGKSTLLDALCGFRPATGGRVLLNGVDLYENFDAYRHDVGYVPQDDIIHRELLVRRALTYAAELRMPRDTTREERERRVWEVLRDLDLLGCADLPVNRLSGGQRKRVSIGVELLTRPSLFFLDEATSGLDPGTESQMMKLLRRLADQGRTVLLVTHATKNVMVCDKVVFLARGGHLAFFGAPDEALTYFGVSDFDEIYNRLEAAEPQAWGARFRQSSQYQQYVEQRLAQVVGQPYGYGAPWGYPAQPAYGPAQPPPGYGYSPPAAVPGSYGVAPVPPQRAAPDRGSRGRIGSARQFAVLSRRYIDTILRDRKTAALLMLIAPILGALDFVVWDRQLFDPVKGSATQAVTMLFMVTLITILVGTVTSVREIVKEDAIYRRERMVGLKVLPYIGSKVAVGLLFAIYSALVLFIFKLLAVDMSHLGGADLMKFFVPMVLGTFAGVAWGLLVSAVAPSEDRAMLLVILVLVPQFVFSGGMVPVADLGVAGKVLGVLTSTRWQLGAMATAAQIKTGACEAPDLSDCRMPGLEALGSVQEKQALLQSLDNQYGSIFDVNVYFYWAMSLAIALALLAITVVLQKRKDKK